MPLAGDDSGERRRPQANEDLPGGFGAVLPDGFGGGILGLWESKQTDGAKLGLVKKSLTEV